MEIVKFFQDVTDSFNEKTKCGECWVFKAPLSESGMNSTNFAPGEECCVKLFLTYYQYLSGYVRNQSTGLQKTGYCDFIFTLHAVKETELGVNVLNEEPGHGIDESLWKTILWPLEECLGCGTEFDLCDLGYDFDIIKWSMVPTIVKNDNNYVGWKIDGIFRQYR